MKISRWLLLLSLLLLQAGSAAGASPLHVDARLIADVKAIQPGVPFKVGVALQMKDGWHTYYKISGDAGMPTKIEWSLPRGSRVGPILWPKPVRFNDGGIITYGYNDHAVLVSQLTPPEKLGVKSFDISARVKWLECKDICVPGGAELHLSLPVAASGQVIQQDNTDQFNFSPFEGLPVTDVLSDQLSPTGFGESKLGLLGYLAYAFAGGLILNVMPCVLPVISIKVLSLINQASEERKRIFTLGLVFASGVLCTFAALGLVVIALKTAGQSIGWGFQFQLPGFLIGISALIFLLALSLLGVFYIDLSGTGKGIGRLAARPGLAGTFFNGVLATILATPCTAPFLGTALGFALAQSSWMILLIFLIIGLGMSAPYLLLAANPSWMSYVPKPGKWMETFEQLMGFVLLGTVVWLLSVLGHQVGQAGVIRTISFLTAAAFAVWLFKHLVDLRSSARRTYASWLIALGIVFGAYILFITPVLSTTHTDSLINTAEKGSTADSGGIAWEPFSVQRLNNALSNGQSVLIDFTADWCLTCKVNEQTVLNTPEVTEKIKSLHIVPLRADWTTQNAEISSLMQRFGRSGVPLYVIFRASKPNEPIVLPEIITKNMVIDNLMRVSQ